MKFEYIQKEVEQIAYPLEFKTHPKARVHMIPFLSILFRTTLEIQLHSSRGTTLAFFTGSIILCQILTDVAFKTLTTVPIMSNIIYNGVIGRGFFGLIS